MALTSRKQPLYDQLVDILSEKIEHECVPGDMLPSERDLSERYGLSRTTVRLALQELESLGLVIRQHGRGTFVADRSVHTANLMQTYSFTQQMREIGRDPKTIILEFSEIEADKNLAEHMGLRLGEKVIKVDRLRCADDMPLMIERTHLPMRKFMMFKRPMLEGKSLYEVIEGAPVLDLERVTYNMHNEIIEYTLSVARADQFKYKVFHYRNGAK